jgi:hypothetical protein
MTVPEAADQLRVDYYAGMIAILAVILVAKFVTHRGKSPETERASQREHQIAVVIAGLGAGGCLVVLGWANPNGLDRMEPPRVRWRPVVG